MTNNDTTAATISPREAIAQAIDATNRESATWPKNMSDAEAYGRFADSILASLAGAGLTELESAEKRIQAVRDLHRPVGLTAHTGPRIKPGGEPVPDDIQVCGYCTDPDALGWCEYPCPTIEALNGEAFLRAAAQEPTDAEVEAAAKAIYLFEGGYHTEASWGREKVARRDHYLTSAFAALSAARKA